MEEKRPNPFTTVTAFSKILALITFITLPFVGFYFGLNYQKAITTYQSTDVLIKDAAKFPKSVALKLEFKDLTVTLDGQSTNVESRPLFNLPVKKVDGPIINSNPADGLFKEAVGANLYYSRQADYFYDLQPGGYSQLRLTDSKDLENLSENSEKTDKISHTSTKTSCTTFRYPVGSVDATAVSCNTNITNLDTGFGDESTTANCYLPLETGKFLAYEQKVKPTGTSINMCEQLSQMGVTGVTWLKSAPKPQETSSAPALWKNYRDETLSFSYPSDWEVTSRQVFASRSEVGFEFRSGTPFTVSYVANYNNGTGRPYSSLSEYLGAIASKARKITVDGLTGLRVSSAGDPGHAVPFEEAVFYSPDKKSVVSLYLQSAYYQESGTNAVLDKILATLKFSK